MRPLGPNPQDRPNWETMNEGQRRYAMEQWNLARVRRGERFDPPSDDDGTDAGQVLNDFINEVDLPSDDELPDIDLLFDSDDDVSEHPSQSQGEPSSQGSSQASGVSDFLNQVRERQNMDVDGGVSSSSGGGGVKRQQSNQGGKALKANKQGDTRIHGSALPGTSGNTDGMDDSTGIGGAQGVPHVFRAPKINILSQSFRFEKQWKFTSFGVAPQIIKTTAGNEWGLTSSLVNIPWEYAFMYMSPAEYNRMKDFPGIHAVSCHIKITQFNPRVAFNTGETLSQTATLNQNKFLLIAEGLKNYDYMKVLDLEYTYDTTEPMKPTAFKTTTGEQSRDQLKTYMYGLDNNSSIFSTIVPTAASGSELELLRYATCFIPVNDNSKLAGFPPFNNHVHEFNAMDFVGKPILEKSYHFKYAPLQAAREYLPAVNTTGLNAYSVPTGTKNEIMKEKNYTVASDTLAQADATSQLTRKANGVQSNYFADPNTYTKYPMEQDGAFMENNDRGSGHSQQPSLHVGVRAVPKLTTIDDSRQATSWLDTQMYYYMTCELICKSDDKYPNLKHGPFNVSSKAQFQATSGNNWVYQSYDQQNFQGRYTNNQLAIV